MYTTHFYDAGGVHRYHWVSADSMDGATHAATIGCTRAIVYKRGMLVALYKRQAAQTLADLLIETLGVPEATIKQAMDTSLNARLLLSSCTVPCRGW